MKTRTLAMHMAVLSALLAGAALQTVAQPIPGGPSGPGPLSRWEMTADQQAKVRKATQASENERAELQQKIAAARREAVAAALAQNPDEKLIRSKLDAVAKLQNEL
jgi:hypothetical protein